MNKKPVSSIIYCLVLLWGSVPIHILGWLVGAIVRHPEVDHKLQSEAVYKFISVWMGGLEMIHILPLIIVFAVIATLSNVLRQKGYGQPEDGLSIGKNILIKILLPVFLSPFCFAYGLFASAKMMPVGYSLSSLLGLVFFIGFIHYHVSEPPSQEPPLQ